MGTQPTLLLANGAIMYFDLSDSTQITIVDLEYGGVHHHVNWSQGHYDPAKSNSTFRVMGLQAFCPNLTGMSRSVSIFDMVVHLVGVC